MQPTSYCSAAVVQSVSDLSGHKYISLKRSVVGLSNGVNLAFVADLDLRLQPHQIGAHPSKVPCFPDQSCLLRQYSS